MESIKRKKKENNLRKKERKLEKKKAMKDGKTKGK